MEIGQVAATNAVIRPYENPDGGGQLEMWWA